MHTHSSKQADRSNRADYFKDAALIPVEFRTELEVIWHAVFATETEVAQGHRAAFVTLNARRKTVVTLVGRGPLPIHDAPVLCSGKVAETTTLARKQRAKSDEFTGRKLGLWVLGHVPHPAINWTKELCNNVPSLDENLRDNGFS